ncbi:MAG TPA: MARVEL domain-containing protein, partial [Pirellulales bacterium]|nr:MARVEL domain-containing protein [Pirellulales bacterium]
MAFSADSQRKALAELYRLSAEREQAERTMRAEFETATARIQRELSDARQSAIMQFQLARDTTQREYDSAIAGTQAAYETRHDIAADELKNTLAAVELDFAKAQRKAKKKLTEENWETNTVYEATHNGPKLQFDADQQEILARHDVVRKTIDVANRHLTICRLSTLRRIPAPKAADSADAAQSEHPAWRSEEAAPLPENPALALGDLAMAAVNHLEAFRKLRWPNLLVGKKPAGFVFLLLALGCGAGYGIFGTHNWTKWTWLIVGAVVGIIASVALLIWLFRKAKAVAAQPYDQLHAMLHQAEELRVAAISQTKKRCIEETRKIVERRDNELKDSREKFDTRMTEAQQQHAASQKAAHDKHERTEAELVQTRDAALTEAHTSYPKRLEEIQQRYQSDLRTAQQHSTADTLANRQKRDQTWNDLAEHWRAGMAQVRAVIEENIKQTQQFFPAWSDPRWNTWQPPTAAAPTLPFGHYHVDLHTIPGAISSDEQLNGLLPTQFNLPALLPFPQNASLLFKATGEGRRIAIEAVQAEMLRMITSIPPGKVRFTIVDPVGLGENFAGFMHLADHDELLVTNRIWTEPSHIEARLSDLTEQMENVIQKYLRNEFHSIDEYNVFAGEVAEPFRVLVVANFPVNFTETAARRLTSIASSGARCGVYVLLVNDVKLPLPPLFDMKDVEKHVLTLNWNGKQFAWQDPDFERYPLRLESPPPEEQFTQLVQIIGRGAKAAKRVEVPFDYVAPPRDKWWTGDTSSNIRVPLGRAGATKLQYLQ